MSRRRRCARYARGLGGLTLVAVGAGLWAAGCSSERQFDARGLVAELNAAGAGLELGAALPDATEELDLTFVGFIDSDPGSGAVAILDDADAARAEFSRCESATSFVCFRAANAVLRFAEIDRAEQARLSAALTALDNTAEG